VRSAVIIAIGFLLLAACVLAPRFAGRPEWSVMGTKLFIALWLAAALANMWIGVSRAGYSVAEELPIFLVIFALPSVPAAYVWWKFG